MHVETALEASAMSWLANETQAACVLKSMMKGKIKFVGFGNGFWSEWLSHGKVPNKTQAPQALKSNIKQKVRKIAVWGFLKQNARLN